MQNLILRYDDRHTFPAAIKTIESENILKIESNEKKNVAIATEIGTATVTLEDGSIYNVTVEPAPLSVFLILGQSNAEGSTTSEVEDQIEARNRSIICQEGQVYSTYTWSTLWHSDFVSGCPSQERLNTENAANYVAKSLTSSLSRSGQPLEYPLNSMAAGQKGKTGIDSGLAWKWNQLTGEKVWVINCAAGNTKIDDDWSPGKERYENCLALMEQVRKTAEEEIFAKHYILKNFCYFWLQGESNCTMSREEYRAYFETMHAELMKHIRLTEDTPLQGCGILTVRAFVRTNDERDIEDNGPRLAQKDAIAAKEGVFSNVFLACDANDQWISAQAITEYWEKAYPNADFPFTAQREQYPNPTTIREVHNGVHYHQPGYNEIGILAAQATLDYLK